MVTITKADSDGEQRRGPVDAAARRERNKDGPEGETQ